MNIHELKAQIEEINSFLEVLMSDDINEAVERGNQLAVYINRTGNMLADAKHLLNESMNSEVISIIKTMVSEKYSAKVQNALIDSVAREERFLVDKIEQLNKTAKYQIEWCRTIISKAKEEMKYLNLQ